MGFRDREATRKWRTEKKIVGGDDVDLLTNTRCLEPRFDCFMSGGFYGAVMQCDFLVY